MDGFKAYKYYMAIKLHFSNPKFNVFENRGRIRGTYQAFQTRNDSFLFEKIARQYPDDRKCIQYFASNFMYGNPNVVYSAEEAVTNYKEYIRRRQSITRIFVNDLDTISDLGVDDETGCLKPASIIQLLVGGKITLETAVVLNDMDGFVSKLKQSPMALILGDELMKVEKSRGFVKYDSYKIMDQYQQFLDNIKGTVNG